MRKLILFTVFILLFICYSMYPKNSAKNEFNLKISKEEFQKILKEQKAINVIITFDKTTWFGEDDLQNWAKKENVNLNEMLVEVKKGFEDKIIKYKKINFKLSDENNIKNGYTIKINLKNIYYVIAPMTFGYSEFSINMLKAESHETIADGFINSSKNIYNLKKALFNTGGIGLAETLIETFDSYLK